MCIEINILVSKDPAYFMKQILWTQFKSGKIHLIGTKRSYRLLICRWVRSSTNRILISEYHYIHTIDGSVYTISNLFPIPLRK